MLVPIGHENMSARRWPVITLGLILLNFGVFLSTHWVMETQGYRLPIGSVLGYPSKLGVPDGI
jgi:hypothetical protein